MNGSLLAWWVLAPLGAAAAFGALAPAFARRLPPRSATFLCSVGGLVLAGSSTVALALVVAPIAGELAPLRALGHWSARRLGAGAPFETSVAGAAAIALVLAAGRLVTVTWRVGTGLGGAWRASRAATGPLVVLPHHRPCAYALPGWPGRIVASAGLLRALTSEERRALLAHEQAHLDAHHDLHRAAARLAAASNPLLSRLPAAVELATERWADEAAAVEAGDRALVARTIAKAAPLLATQATQATQAAPGPPSARLAAAATDVAARIRALLSAPPAGARWRAALLAGLVLVGATATAVAGGGTEHLFDLATRGAPA